MADNGRGLAKLEGICVSALDGVPMVNWPFVMEARMCGELAVDSYYIVFWCQSLSGCMDNWVIIDR